MSDSPRGRGRNRPPLLLIALLTVAVLAAAVAALTPPAIATGVPLASGGSNPTGALALYQLLARLHWRPERQRTPVPTLPRDAIYVAVRTDHGVDATSAGQVLAAVREGAGLVVDVRPEDPLSDSLELVLAHDRGGIRPIDNRAAATALDGIAALERPDCRSAGATEVAAGTQYVQFTFADSGAAAAARAGRRVLLDVSEGTGRAPVVLGFPYGRGRVVAFADASLLTNAALRACWAAAAVVAVRTFEWVSPVAGASTSPAPSARPRVVFFEGFRDPATAPRTPSVLRAVRRALSEVPAGRMVAQLLAAALVLLAAVGVRALPPEPAPQPTRRSPLEHVGALARAYREVRASRVAARRLAGGLRRRYGAAGAPGAAAGGPTGGSVGRDPDAHFLAGIAVRHPARAADVARLTAALDAPVSPAEVVAVGDAAARIARTLDAARRGADVGG